MRLNEILICSHFFLVIFHISFTFSSAYTIDIFWSLFRTCFSFLNGAYRSSNLHSVSIQRVLSLISNALLCFTFCFSVMLFTVVLCYLFVVKEAERRDMHFCYAWAPDWFSLSFFLNKPVKQSKDLATHSSHSFCCVLCSSISVFHCLCALSGSSVVFSLLENA